MTYAQGLRFGTSLSFCQKIDRDTLSALKAAGIAAAELSFGFDYFMNQIDFPKNWLEYSAMAREEEVELWSIHLPFSAHLDISHVSSELKAITLYTHRLLIEAAGRAGVKIAVLHPSSEPIKDEDRSEKLRRSREAIILLNGECEKYGMKLAVENLPRTCLCNRAAEMVALLEGTGAGIIFDANHSLLEENVGFLSSLVDSGLKIHSLHISDYDFVDERHRLPGDGLNNWHGIFAQLERAGYAGPMLYEVSRQPKERDEISLSQLTENMKRLGPQGSRDRRGGRIRLGRPGAAPRDVLAWVCTGRLGGLAPRLTRTPRANPQFLSPVLRPRVQRHGPALPTDEHAGAVLRRQLGQHAFGIPPAGLRVFVRHRPVHSAHLDLAATARAYGRLSAAQRQLGRGERAARGSCLEVPGRER